jgi:hypothetical protein
MTDSPLTPNERSIMLCLAIGAMAERTGSDTETAEDQLDGYAINISGDEHEVMLEVADQVLVRAPRAWLADLDRGKSDA